MTTATARAWVLRRKARALARTDRHLERIRLWQAYFTLRFSTTRRNAPRRPQDALSPQVAPSHHQPANNPA